MQTHTLLDFNAIVTILSLVVTSIGVIYYFIDIFNNKTKPSVITWLTWSILDTVVFVSQLLNGGGVGSLIVGLSALTAFFIFLLAIKFGSKHVKPLDWFFFICAMLTIVLWIFTGDPLLSIILAAIIDTLGFIPTFIKSYKNPYQETPINYIASSVKYLMSFAALESLAAVNIIFPIEAILSETSFVVFIYIRRHIIRKKRRETANRNRMKRL